MFEWTGACLASLDPQLRLVTANLDFFQQFGGTPDDRRGKSLLDLVHPGARERIRRRFTTLNSPDNSHFTDRITALSARGGAFAGTLTGVASRDTHGEIHAVLVVIKPDPVAPAPPFTNVPDRRRHPPARVDVSVVLRPPSMPNK